MDTRERILAAAAAIIAEKGATARLSVRTVAVRAGVSVGSLRHHFPTQQALRDQLMERIGEWLLPGDWIDDQSLPAAERLTRNLRQLLAQSGHGQQARDAMMAAISIFVAGDQTDEVRETYLATEKYGQQRIERWLDVLAAEGLLLASDVTRRARFLATVLKGLAMERAFPAIDALAQTEDETLAEAVAAVLRADR